MSVIRRAFAGFSVLCLGMAGLRAAEGSQQPVGGEVPAEIRELLAAMASPSTEAHREATEKLASMGERALPAVPQLIAFMGMGTFSWDGVDDRGRMTGGSIAHGQDAEMVLVRIGKPVVEPLLKYLAARAGADPPGSAAAAEGAVRVLGKLKDERAVDPIIRCLRDKAYGVQAAAMEALLEYETPAVADKLAEALKSKTGSVREGATWVLIRKKDPRVFQLIQRRLASPYPDVRQEAIGDLVVFGGPQAIQSLSSLAKKDSDAGVRKAAAEALKTLQPK